MSVLAAVLGGVKRGVPAERLGPVLGVDDSLAAAALDHWVRLGVVTPAGDLALGCTSCPALGTTTTSPGPADHAQAGERSPACAACPFGR